MIKLSELAIKRLGENQTCHQREDGVILQQYYCKNKSKHSKQLENLRSHINVHTHASSTFVNHLTLTFDLLISGTMHDERLP